MPEVSRLEVAVAHDVNDSVGQVADELKLARHRLELLIVDAEAGNGSAWFALNDAAHCVQRAIDAVATLGMATANS